MQYLLGYAHFMDFTFFVDENVLIPRSDTEILVESVNDMFEKMVSAGKKTPESILDLCCGSGCIGISIKLYHKDSRLTLSDISDKALMVAQKNLEKYDITANINCGDLFEGIGDRYDLIVCNPPYIKSAIIKTLMPEVREYEPVGALDGGEDGAVFYRRIIEAAYGFLNENGYVYFEIGYDQGKEVSDMMKNAGYKDVVVIKDYAGLDRVVSGHL